MKGPTPNRQREQTAEERPRHRTDKGTDCRGETWHRTLDFGHGIKASSTGLGPSRRIIGESRGDRAHISQQ
jgi:hypothetical protein